jgi:N-hydroxyarylamine O-acetyltransferase
MTMHDAIDLQAYLRRIGWQGAVAPDMSTLQALVVAHVAAIPFENLNPLLGLPVSLELAALEHKLVREGRGGYCFEQNLLFEAVLRTIGFEVSGLIARVLWTRPEDAITPQTHMLLRVELAGESWLVDVGFGGQNLVGVLRLQADTEQATPLEPFRLLQVDGDWRMQSLVRGQWLSLYRFDLRPVPLIDYIVANHYVSTHPDSFFVNNLNVARTTSDSRLSLRNREFTVRRMGHEPERRTLGSVAEIRQVLENEFLIRLPTHLQLDQRLDSLPDNVPA